MVDGWDVRGMAEGGCGSGGGCLVVTAVAAAADESRHALAGRWTLGRWTKTEGDVHGHRGRQDQQGPTARPPDRLISTRSAPDQHQSGTGSAQSVSARRPGARRTAAAGRESPSVRHSSLVTALATVCVCCCAWSAVCVRRAPTNHSTCNRETAGACLCCAVRCCDERNARLPDAV